MRSKKTGRVILTLLALATALSSFGATIFVPPELQTWRGWVLQDNKVLACPLGAAGGRAITACAWPGRLSMDVGNSGASFEQRVEAFAEIHFELPGDNRHWPQDVTANGNSVAVTEQNGAPTIILPPGNHRLRGRFLWSRKPQTLRLGSGTGMLALRIAGQDVPRPRWDQGRVWIAGDAPPVDEKTSDQIRVDVYRIIRDGAPTYLDMRIVVTVSGASREAVIGRLLPDGFDPASMSAPLPARIGNDGQLTIQARPGTHEFTLRAVAPKPLAKLVFEPSGEFWPREEIWSVDFDPQVRVIQPAAANPIDPAQAGVSEDARHLPGFRMTPGDELVLEERQRGLAGEERDHFNLRRHMWLDFDGGGYTLEDNLSGQMTRDWRLDMASPVILKSASLSEGDAQTSLLITRNPDEDSLTGVEIRTNQVELKALARLDAGPGALPVSGWQARIDGVHTNLSLPPGYRLLHAAGADSAPHSWLRQWHLADFFLLLIISVALWRMYAPWVGVLAFATLAVSLHELGAPAWLWLNLVVAFALTKYLPPGHARRSATILKIASVALLVITLLPFAAQQLKTAVYPQLEAYGERGTAPSVRSQARFDENTLDEVVVTGSRMQQLPEEVAQTSGYIVERKQRPSISLSRYANDAQVQAGPGEPQWDWRNHALHWSGPVTAQQTMRLWIVPPWLSSVWRVASVLLAFALLGALFVRDPRGLKLTTKPAAGAAWLALAVLPLLGGAPPASAQTPSPELLDELRQRLSRLPDCAPRCVDINRATVRFDAQRLVVELIVHAAADSYVAVPGTTNGWRPETVNVDGKDSDALALANGQFEVLIKAGVRRVLLDGALPNANSLTLNFPQRPRHIDLDGSQWEATGVTDNRLDGGALTLIRQRAAEQASRLDAIDVEQFPPFVLIHRIISFDLDWHVETMVQRVSPQTAAINLRIPLLDGESITSSGIEASDGYAMVSLATGSHAAGWRSTLPRVTAMTLTAPADVRWQERWQVRTGASWSTKFDGVPQLDGRQTGANASAQFAPWQGETLTIAIDRPDAQPGETLTFIGADLRHDIGRRSSEHTLALRYRATRGAQHAISLPPASELLNVSSNGETINLALAGDTLRLPVQPGEGSYQISWRSEGGSQVVVAGQRPDLAIATSNLSVATNLPADRWIIWTRGPRIGPAVLLWGELLLFGLLAFALARYGRTPLKFRHWLLLGLGFSTFLWPAFAIVAAALVAMGWRERHVVSQPAAFNAVQIGLGALLFFAAIALATTIPLGLLGAPNMHIAGGHAGGASLSWFADRSAGLLPATTVVSLPMWVYKGLILLWSLWLAFAVLRWLPWIWAAFSDGGYWKRLKPVISAPPGQSKTD